MKQSVATEVQWQRFLSDESATVQAGGELAEAAGDSALTIHLQGELGAGKTTFCRGVVQYFGHSGAVKSPTYTLVEPYELAEKSIYHFDLYRIAAADELSYLGLDDYFEKPGRLCLIEWPERGEGLLPQPDILLQLSYSQSAAASSGAEQVGRELRASALSETGLKCLAKLAQAQPH